MSSENVTSHPHVANGQGQTVGADNGLGYSRHYAQRIRDLGKTSKESWIKRLWNHMFGNHTCKDSGEIFERASNCAPVAEDVTKHESERRHNTKQPSEVTTQSKEVRFKDTGTKNREDSAGSSHYDDHSGTKSTSSHRPYSAHDKTLEGLPVQLLNSPYLPPKERIVFYKSLKSRESLKDSQVKSRYMNSVSKSMSALGSSGSVHSSSKSEMPPSHRQSHPYLSQLAREQTHLAFAKSRVTRDATVIQLEKKAKTISDKSVKSSKIFTCDAPYPVDAFVRISLRKRGWVEKFGPKVMNATTMATSPAKLEVSTDEDYQLICDVGFPKPWQEDYGLYAVMSRLVHRHPAKFIWGGKSVNNLVLKSDVIVNHFPKAKYFSSKVLLATSLRDLAWHNNTDSLTFFPRCYLLNDDDKQDIIEDFHITACMSLLKLVVEMYDPSRENSLRTCDNNDSDNCIASRHEEVSKEVDSKDDENSKGDTDGDFLTTESHDDADHLSPSNNEHVVDVSSSDQVVVNTRTCDSFVDSQDAHDVVEENGTQCAADINDDIDDKVILSKMGQVKVVPDLKAKSRERKGGRIPGKAVDWAIAQCNRFVSSKHHEDIDSKGRRGLYPGQWNQLMSWFYQVSQDGATVSLSERKLQDCEDALKRIKQVWPQYDLDGMRNIWIIKPGDKSKGIGICFCDNLDEIIKMLNNQGTQEYIVQKYIERPLLIYECKFDIRQWFLVTDWLPLTVWFYKISYLRICSQEFSYDSMHESVHLSNVAVQENYINGKRSDKLPENNFMTNEQFKEYLSEVGAEGMWEKKIYPGMKEAVINTLVATQEVTDHRRSAFELYGADFMMSEDYTPWLLEVNSSPGMLPSSIEKAKLCSSVIEDTIRVVLDHRENSSSDTGRFELIYHDTTNPNTRGLDSKLFLEGQRIKRPDLQRYTMIDQKAMKIEKDREEKTKERERRRGKAEAGHRAREERAQHGDTTSENANGLDSGCETSSASPLSHQSSEDLEENLLAHSQQLVGVDFGLTRTSVQAATATNTALKDKQSSRFALRSTISDIYGGSAQGRNGREKVPASTIAPMAKSKTTVKTGGKEA